MDTLDSQMKAVGLMQKRTLTAKEFVDSLRKTQRRQISETAPQTSVPPIPQRREGIFFRTSNSCLPPPPCERARGGGGGGGKRRKEKRIKVDFWLFRAGGVISLSLPSSPGAVAVFTTPITARDHRSARAAI